MELPQPSELFEAAEQRWLRHWQRGPTRRKWTTLPVQTGDTAPDFELLDSARRVHHLSDSWKSHPALMIFWRHFGCGCGVGRAERLREEYDRLVEAGAEVVVIGQGDPERAAFGIRRNSRFHAPSLSILTSTSTGTTGC